MEYEIGKVLFATLVLIGLAIIGVTWLFLGKWGALVAAIIVAVIFVLLTLQQSNGG